MEFIASYGQHHFPSGHLFVILLLAVVTCIYGFISLRKARFKMANGLSSIEQSDKMVIGFFNLLISLAAITILIVISG